MSREPPNAQLYTVTKTGNIPMFATVLERRPNEAYIHYMNTDRRMDEWVSDSQLRPASEAPAEESGLRGVKRKRESITPGPLPLHDGVLAPDGTSTPTSNIGSELVEEEDKEILVHRLMTSKRNYHTVIFGHWKMKTWYFSPYPLGVDDHTATSHIRITGATLPSNFSRSKLKPKDVPAERPQSRSQITSSEAPTGVVASEESEEKTLWVCDRCFKYMKEGASWELHLRTCDPPHPPGRKVYQRGAHTIWEVDGAKSKLYCQNLSLFGKFFIDIKTLFFDCENFMFYVLTDAEPKRDHVLGFFSKEKVSYDDFNLACIVILPPYQKKGYGMLLIEFSYELSRRAQKIGTPERPLSDLGLRSYVTYWVSVLVRFFRKVLTVAPPEAAERIENPNPDDGKTLTRRKKRAKGWDGEVPAVFSDIPQGSYISLVEEPTFGSLRTTHTTPSAIDGSATTHLSVKCTLLDIAKATNLRPEDVAYAMEECGFLLRRKNEGKNDDGSDREVILVSREMVEAVAKERGVKDTFISVNHVIL